MKDNFNILEYIKTKGNPTLALLEFMKHIKETCLEMIKEVLSKDIPPMVEGVKKEISVEIKQETLSFMEKNASMLKGKDGKDGANGKDGKDGKDGVDGLNGIDGIDGTDGKDGKNGIDGKDGKDGKDGSPDTREDIVKKINSGKVEDIKIDYSQITGIPKLKEKAGKGVVVKGGQGSWKQKQLSGTINGSNTIFTFSGEEPAEFSERIFLNYLEQNPFTDYSINYKTRTITYTTAPDASLSSLPHLIRYM